MADRSKDSTRELIAGAEELLSKGKRDGTVDRLVSEAHKVTGAKKSAPPPATRDLVVEAEQLLGRKRAAQKGAEPAKKRGGMIWVVLAAVAAAGVALFLLR